MKDRTNEVIGSMTAKQLELSIDGKGLSELNSALTDVPKRPIDGELERSAVKMEDIAEEGNLRAAYEAVKKNDGAPGVDRQSVAAVGREIETVIPELHRQLLAETYKPGEVRRVWIPKSGSGLRGLGIPNVIDRIVQQATYQKLSPGYEATFYGSSHGFRPGKSCHTAIEEAKCYLKEGYEYVVDLDIEKFFDQVNHDRLMAKLKTRIEDRRILKLIHLMLKAKTVMPDGVKVANEEGVPQGGPLSPLLANIVLHELDEELTRRGHKFVRYADDCNIYVHSERAGQRVFASISQFIEKRLRLKVNREKSAVAKPNGRHFLGFTLAWDKQTGEVEIGMSPRTKKRIAQRIVELTPRKWGRSLDDCILGLNQYLQGWINFFKICTPKELRLLNGYDAHIRRRLRAIKLKHWKRKRYIVRALISLGVSCKTAWRNVYRAKQSLWKLSHNPAVERGLRNAYFAERGLKSLAQMWRNCNPQYVTVAVETCI